MKEYIKMIKNYKIGRKLFITTFISCLLTIAITISSKALRIGEYGGGV